MRKLKVGTRGSRLALAQTEIALAALRISEPNTDFEVVRISTRGDIDKRPLFTIDEKGIFEKEVNDAVKSGLVDFAVHSMKDIPSDLTSELIVASVPKRGKPNDVLVADRGRKLEEIDPDGVVGTSSLRRAIQLQRIRPDLKVRPIRGNVETRVKKVISREFAAVILAEAGLRRMGMQDVITERFSTRCFMPAPGQGAIGIVCRAEDRKTAAMIKKTEDPVSRAEIMAERALIQNVEGGCRFPLGALALASGNKIILSASVFSADGAKNIKARERGSIREPHKLGQSAAQALIELGAMEFAKGWREAVRDWNKNI